MFFNSKSFLSIHAQIYEELDDPKTTPKRKEALEHCLDLIDAFWFGIDTSRKRKHFKKIALKDFDH